MSRYRRSVEPSTSRAFVREPSPKLAEGELTHLRRVPVDLGLAQQQHRAYRDCLERLGVTVDLLPPAPDLPDAVFVEDTVVMVDDVAVITHPGALSRRPEIDTVRAELEAEGYPLREITPPATLDGGDVLLLGDVVYVGRSSRTDDDAIAQLRDLMVPFDRRVVPVDVTHALHLKTAATALPDGRVIAVRDWFDSAAIAAEILDAPEPQGANVLSVNGTVVVAADAPRTAELVRTLGFPVEVLDISEFQKVEAGLTCLSVLV